jgi:hypothetical protein
MKVAFETREAWSRRVSTGQLNRWFEKAIEANPPPAPGGKRIKPRYVTQNKSRPPSFILFGTRVDLLPVSYQRYLINSLRKEFDFGAVPVRLTLRAPKNPFDHDKTWPQVIGTWPGPEAGFRNMITACLIPSVNSLVYFPIASACLGRSQGMDVTIESDPLVNWEAFSQARSELGANFVRILGYFREDGVKSVERIEEAMRAHNTAGDGDLPRIR